MKVAPKLQLGTVLVVDDQPNNIQLLAKILTEEKIEVIPATSTEQAIQRLSVQLPDLILLDVYMPITDGIVCCHLIKNNPLTSHIPIIFLSASDNKDIIIKAFNAGGVDYISKPFNRHELLARVRTHLSLKQAIYHLEKLAMEKEELMAMLAHDLKNPLSSILLACQSLQLQAELPPLAARLTSLIEETAQGMHEFIELYLHKKASDRFIMEKRRFKNDQDSLVINQEYLKNLLLLWHLNAQKKQIQLNFNYLPSEEITIQVDSIALEKILENLISNAIKFSESNTTVSLSVYLENENLCFDVRDQGPGLQEEDIQHLFQRYTRLSAKPTAGESSTGLGLSIAKQLSEEMGAELTAYQNSETDIGGRFTLKIPIN